MASSIPHTALSLPGFPFFIPPSAFYIQHSRFLIPQPPILIAHCFPLIASLPLSPLPFQHLSRLSACRRPYKAILFHHLNEPCSTVKSYAQTALYELYRGLAGHQDYIECLLVEFIPVACRNTFLRNSILRFVTVFRTCLCLCILNYFAYLGFIYVGTMHPHQL